MEQSARPLVLLVDDNDAMLARANAVLTPACIVVGMVKDGQARRNRRRLCGLT